MVSLGAGLGVSDDCLALVKGRSLLGGLSLVKDIFDL